MKKLIFVLSIFFIGINSIFAKETVKFSSCIDGDTMKVIIDGQKETVRFLAIDTPENSKEKVDYYGKEASDYTCQKITNAKKIELEYDKNSDKTDKYGRVLAWIFIDGKLLQEELIEKGYAKVAYLYAEYKYTNLLKEKQEIASAKNIGVWNSKEAQKFNNNSSPLSPEESTITEEENIENIEVIVIGIVMLIITFVGGLFIKREGKSKGKKKD